MTTPGNQSNNPTLSSNAGKCASQVVVSRMQLTLHATRRIPHGAPRLVQSVSAWSVKPDVFRPGMVSMVIRLRPCTPPPCPMRSLLLFFRSMVPAAPALAYFRGISSLLMRRALSALMHRVVSARMRRTAYFFSQADVEMHTYGYVEGHSFVRIFDANVVMHRNTSAGMRCSAFEAWCYHYYY